MDFDYSKEMAKLKALSANPDFDKIKDAMYAMEREVAALTGDPLEVTQKATILRENYREKVRQMDEARKELITDQWLKIKAHVTSELNLQNNPKTELAWNIAWVKAYPSGYEAVIKEFKDLVPLIKD